MLSFLRLHNPATHIVLAGLLPRGGLLPATRFAWPSDFTPVCLQLSVTCSAGLVQLGNMICCAGFDLCQ